MNREDATNWSLIGRLASSRGTEEDWRKFDGIYRGLIRAIASQSGLSAAEIEDVEQETMRTIWKKMSSQDSEFRIGSEYGAFRAWLRSVVRYRIQDQLRKRMPVSGGSSDRSDETARTSTIDRIPDAKEVKWEELFDREYQQQLYNRAVEMLRHSLNPLHFQIFDFYVLRGLPIEKIARGLEVSESLIYTTKNRVVKKLSQEVARLEQEILQARRPSK
jgi:RNA polymerase sigma factor (sigma-70 family)